MYSMATMVNYTEFIYLKVAKGVDLQSSSHGVIKRKKITI